MGIAHSIARVTACACGRLVGARGGSCDGTRGFEGRLDHSELFTAVSDGPVAARLANDFDLLQESTLVP